LLGGARQAAAANGISGTDRVMSTAGWGTSDQLIQNMLGVLIVGASLVQVAHPDTASMQRRRESEKITRELPAQ
jgi:hypothetical protein